MFIMPPPTRKKPNILFVNLPNVALEDIETQPSAFDSFHVPKLYLPLGILYLSSYIKKYSHVGRVGMADYALHLGRIRDSRSMNDFIAEVAKEAADYKPEMILVSLLFSISKDFGLRAIRVLSQLWPDATVLVGGTHATNDFVGLLDNEDIDYVVRGEGEKPLSEFIRRHPISRDIDIPGVYSRKNRSSGKPPETAEFIQNLDKIPFPDWDLVDIQTYTQARYVALTGREARKNTLSSPILTSRGCPYLCTYCSQHTVHGRRMRYRSIKNVLSEIKVLNSRFHVTTFVPNDDLFISAKKRDIELLSRIRKLGIPEIEFQFPNGLHINSLDPEIMEALIDVGTKIVHLAVESGSEHVQKKLIKKNVDLNKAEEVVSYFRKKEVFVRCYFILGFPDETRLQMRQTIDYAKGLGADWCDFFLAVPLIGSEMYDRFAEKGCFSGKNEKWSKSHVMDRCFDTEEITAEEIKELAYRANLECNFVGNINLKTGNFRKAASLFEDIAERYPFHLFAWCALLKCYKGMKEDTKTTEVEAQIKALIEADSLSKEMCRKHGDLMEKMDCVSFGKGSLL